MAPSKKSKHKKSSRANSISPHKDGGTSKSGLGKRKLSDMLGSQWSEEELELFYDAYRKYGKDWKKVAAYVRTRAVEMVEALYTMNRAYLSLPEGTASVVGLKAMMTDHYCILHCLFHEHMFQSEGLDYPRENYVTSELQRAIRTEDGFIQFMFNLINLKDARIFGQSDSEQESNEGVATARRPQKRARVKSDNSSKGLEGLSDRLQFKSSAGCLSLLKKRRTENVPRAVGKRTPRIPVSFSREDDKLRYLSPIKRGLLLKGDADDDDVAREIALTLAEASQKGGSPHVSITPNSRPKIRSPVKKREKMCNESVRTIARFRGSEPDEDGCEPSLGSTEADNGDYEGSKITRVLEVHQKGKRYTSRKFDVEESDNLHMDDEKEACSGTEEGHNLGTSEVVDGKFSKFADKGSKRKSKKVLFARDEITAFDALQTLADLSLMMPETVADTESSIQVKEEKAGIGDQPKLKRSGAVFGVKTGATKAPKLRKFTNRSVNTTEVDGDSPSGSTVRKRRQKPALVKTAKDEAPTGSHFAETPNVKGVDEVKKLVNRGQRSYNISESNEGKLVKPQDTTCNDIAGAADSVPSTAQVLTTNQVNLPTKVRSRRKIETPNQLMKEDGKSSEDTMKGQSEVLISSLSQKALNLKEKLSHCTTRRQARNWYIFEWFYSAIDYPWFAEREFVEYLDHVGLGHVPRLTRVEWGVIRSSLGKPRRFSSQFLKEEKEKLGLYRDSVREYYAGLHAGTREGLPTDLPRPLKVGQRVIALHRRTREIHDGSVLTVDKSRYRVQFDQAELGVEFVEDIDCMPLNPMENIPASCLKQSAPFIRYVEDHNERTTQEQESDIMPQGYLKLSSGETLDNVSSPCISPSNYYVKSSLEQQKADLINLRSQVKDGIQEAANAQQTVNSQAFAQIQAREADVEALSELTRALDKKELVLSELKHMNDEATESQRDGNDTLKDSESFKKQYAAVLFQLGEVNEQVSFAILRLRQRNTYQGNNNPYMCLRPLGGSGDAGGQIICFDDVASHTQEYGTHAAEIVENSRTNAQKMVVTAMQAMSSLTKEQTCLQNLEEAIDFVNNQLSVDCSSTQVATQDHPLATDQANDTKSNPHVLNDTQIPAELISRCVATLLMIQKCTERQFPPGDVAQVLDSAVASLQPCSSQNLPIYAEIQKCMGIIRNQILALVPT